MAAIVQANGGRIGGEVTPPPSKSAAHRALICAALAGGGRVRGMAHSADIDATAGALAALGAALSWEGDAVRIAPGAPPEGVVTVDCGESGSTLRLLLPVFATRGAARGVTVRFTGGGRLPRRPMGVYEALLPRHGVTLTREGADALPLRLDGRLAAGDYALPGDVSSQFISGLLLALPLCEGDSLVTLTKPLQSAGYVDMTLRAMAASGVKAERLTHGWRVPGGQTYRAGDADVERDWSQAAFLLAAGALGGEVTLRGLDAASAQGDRAIAELLRQFGARVEAADGGLRCARGTLRGIDIDAGDIPDLVPVLAVVGAAASGRTRILNAARLRDKECDRLDAMARGLAALGARVEQRPDALIIHGGAPLRGGRVEGCNDHRVVMSLTVASLLCAGAVEITDPHSIDKSWPDFFEVFQRIGGRAHVIGNR